MRAYIHTYIRTYVHTYIHTYMHTHIHTYMHTHIHTYIHVSRLTVVSREAKEEAAPDGLETHTREYYTGTRVVKIENAITKEP